MEQLLEKLFESMPKARVLRFFVRNPERYSTFDELAQSTQLNSSAARRELAKLMKMGLVKQKIASTKEEQKKKTKKKLRIIIKIKKRKVYFVDPDFPLFSELKNLVAKGSIAPKGKFLQKVKAAGNVKLAIIAGLFLNNENCRTDLLLVGDNLKKGKINNLLWFLESELGRAIRYTVMDTKEFRYRLDMYDRFLRDILEFPHEKLIDKLRI